MQSYKGECELVRRAQNGDRDCLNTLAVQMDRKIRQYITHHFSFDYATVEDLIQEVNLQVVKSLKDCHDPGKFWSWLYRITRNHINSYFRKRFSEKMHSVADMEALEYSRSSRHKPDNDLDWLFTKDLTERLRLALAFLPSDQRLVLMLRYYEQMKYREIVMATDSSIDQVRMKLYRGKQVLKKQVFHLDANPLELLETLGHIHLDSSGKTHGIYQYERKLLFELIEELPCLIYMKDQNSVFSYGNTITARSFGLQNPQALLGRTDFDFMPRSFSRKLYREEQEIMQSGQSVMNRGLRIDYDPAKVAKFSLCTKIPWRDEEGKVIGILGFNRYVEPTQPIYTGKMGFQEP